MLTARAFVQEDTLEGWVASASEIFNAGISESESLYTRSYGFIGIQANDDTEEQVKEYGWKSVYVSVDSLKVEKRSQVIQGIRHVQSGKRRLECYELGLISEEDVYAWYYDLVWRQNNSHFVVGEEGNKRVVEYKGGRWCKKRPFNWQVRKRLKGVLEVVRNPVLLSLTVHQGKVVPVMPYHTNLDPVSFSVANMGKWRRAFMQSLYQYQKIRGIDWRFLGWVMEFQENGFPHVHMIFAGDWLGDISEIAGLWKWSERQGVDVMTRKKLEKELGHKVPAIRLTNYVTSYVSQSGGAIIKPGEEYGKKGKRKVWEGGLSVHRGFAWLAFSGGRVFSMAHERKKGV